MSFVIAAPEMVASAASDLAGLGSTINAANAAAAGSTTGVLAAGRRRGVGSDRGIVFHHAQHYQALSAHAATFMPSSCRP